MRKQTDPDALARFIESEPAYKFETAAVMSNENAVVMTEQEQDEALARIEPDHLLPVSFDSYSEDEVL